ncbi:hypothetical protein IGI43_001390 [Enterococcus sp. AZ126]
MSKRTAFLPIEVSLAKISVVTTNSEKPTEVIVEAIRRTEQYVVEKIKEDLSEISKSMNVRTVGNVLFGVNTRKPRAIKSVKFK